MRQVNLAALNMYHGDICQRESITFISLPKILTTGSRGGPRVHASSPGNHGGQSGSTTYKYVTLLTQVSGVLQSSKSLILKNEANATLLLWLFKEIK